MQDNITITYCSFERRPDGFWQCKRCKWVYRFADTEGPIRRCRNAVDLKPAADKLGIKYEDIPHYAAALARWMAAGFPVRTQAEVKRILEECCKPCKQYVSGKCRLCGCNVNASRFAVANKAKMATEHCKNEKW